MKFVKRIKGVVTPTIILIVSFPISVLLTLLSSSFWLWYEQTFAIEAYGHSGPAEWCYLVTYGIIVFLWAIIWILAKHYRKAA